MVTKHTSLFWSVISSLKSFFKFFRIGKWQLAGRRRESMTRSKLRFQALLASCIISWVTQLPANGVHFYFLRIESQEKAFCKFVSLQPPKSV